MTATKSATTSAASSTTSNASTTPTPSKAARRATLATPFAPLARAALFGAPPLFAGEDGAAYEELLARVAGAVKPFDVIEEIWVHDVVDLAWEALRLRRLKASLMTVAAHEGLARVLMPLLDFSAASNLAAQWAARESGAVDRVDTLLAEAGISMEAIAAQTLAARIDDVERIDRMIMLAEMRRAAALRELDRRRASIAAVLRHALGDAKDVACEDVAPINGARHRRAGSM